MLPVEQLLELREPKLPPLLPVLLDAKEEMRLATFWLPQFGQSISLIVDEERTSFSNSSSQSSHLNS